MLISQVRRLRLVVIISLKEAAKIDLKKEGRCNAKKN
jgi:hypothetical protein